MKFIDLTKDTEFLPEAKFSFPKTGIHTAKVKDVEIKDNKRIRLTVEIDGNDFKTDNIFIYQYQTEKLSMDYVNVMGAFLNSNKIPHPTATREIERIIGKTAKVGITKSSRIYEGKVYTNLKIAYAFLPDNRTPYEAFVEGTDTPKAYENFLNGVQDLEKAYEIERKELQNQINQEPTQQVQSQPQVVLGDTDEIPF